MLTIKTFNDLYPHIKDYPWLEITEKEEDGIISVMYSVLNHADLETDEPLFPNQYTRECRGIKFSSSNKKILARPFNKFFNLGEVEGDLDNHDLSEAKVLEKLDGSMVYPIIHPLTNEVRLCTKAGISDVSVLAEQLTDPPLLVMKEIIEEGYTPIFEFTSPHNRIVIPYGTSSLTLLAVRHMITGEYESDLSSYSQRLRIPEVKHFTGSLALETIKGWEDKEGVVIVWPDGYRVKLKAEAYILRHRNKEAIRFEKDRVQILLEERLDDYKSLMSEDDYKSLQAYGETLISNISLYADHVFNLVNDLKSQGLSKKGIALGPAKELTAAEKWAVFFLYDYSMSKQQFINKLYQEVLKRVTSAGRLEVIREVIGEDSFTS